MMNKQYTRYIWPTLVSFALWASMGTPLLALAAPQSVVLPPAVQMAPPVEQAVATAPPAAPGAASSPTTAVQAPMTENMSLTATPSTTPGVPGSLTLTYNPSPSLTIASTNSTPAATTGLVTQPVGQPVAQNQSNAITVDLHNPLFPTLNFQHLTQSTTLPGMPTVNSSSDALSSTWTKNGLTATATLNRAATATSELGDGSAFAGTSATTSTSQSAQFGLTYQPNALVNLGMNLMTNTAQTNTGGASTATGSNSVQFSASFKPRSNITTTASMQTTITNPTQSTMGMQSPGQQARSLALGTTWSPTRALDLGVNYTANQTTTSAFQPTQQANLTTTPAPALPGSSQQTQTTSVNVAYHPGARLNLSANMSANTTSMSGLEASTSKGSAMQANGTYQAARNLTLTGSVNTTATSATQFANGATSPAQQNGTTTLGANWQATKHANLALQYNASTAQNGMYGKSGVSLVTANLGVKVGRNVTVNTFAGAQQVQNPGAAAATTNNLAGVNVQANMSTKTTVAAGVQHLWGQTSDGVNQLWQSQSTAMTPQITGAGGVGMVSVAGAAVSAVTAGISHRVGSKLDCSLSGQLLQGQGQPGRAGTVGLHYHPSENLSFSLDATREKSGGPFGANNTQLTASVNAKF